MSEFELVMTRIFLPAGYRTASVIIALTDGELHEDLFYYAEREVRIKNTCIQVKHVTEHLSEQINHCRYHFDLFWALSAEAPDEKRFLILSLTC